MSEIKTVDDLIERIEKERADCVYMESSSGVAYSAKRSAYTECIEFTKELKANMEKTDERN